MQKPKLIILDVNGTLLDLKPLTRAVAAVLGGRDDLLPIWFSTMLHYSLVETVTDNFHTFSEVGAAALIMIANSNNIEIDPVVAAKEIAQSFDMPIPYQDVVPGLEALRASGCRIVILSNSTEQNSQDQLGGLQMAKLIDKIYSTERVRKHKPHPDAYQMVLDSEDCKAHDAMMVSAHAWDLVGAARVGLQTAFIVRKGAALYPNTATPDYIQKGLIALADNL